jgi:hypothetical protein
MWSVPDFNITWPGIRTPLLVAMVAGIITYAIVFNLDPLLWFFRRLFSVPREYLLWQTATKGQRRTNGAEKLASIAKNFEVFPRPDDNPRPSDWWLVLFAIWLVLLALFRLIRWAGMKLWGIFWLRRNNVTEVRAFEEAGSSYDSLPTKAGPRCRIR